MYCLLECELQFIFHKFSWFKYCIQCKEKSKAWNIYFSMVLLLMKHSCFLDYFTFILFSKNIYPFNKKQCNPVRICNFYCQPQTNCNIKFLMILEVQSVNNIPPKPSKNLTVGSCICKPQCSTTYSIHNTTYIQFITGNGILGKSPYFEGSQKLSFYLILVKFKQEVAKSQPL